MTISTLTGLISPFYSSAVLAAAILISLFFVLSERKGFKIFVFSIAALSISGALFLSLFYLRATESFSDYLFKFGFLQGIEFIIILFAAFNILIFLAARNFSDKNFIKTVIILLFLLICMNLFIVSNNFLMMFTGLILTLLCVFQILTLFDANSALSSFSRYSIKNHLIRFFMMTVFSLLLILLGFSLVFGATDFKNFTQIIESDKIQVSIVTAGILLIISSIYFLLSLFPFQNSYLKLGRRCEGVSLLVIWFLYFPVGIILLLKVYEPLVYFMEKNNQVFSVVFIIISALSIIGGNIGALKTKSIRRVFLFLFLSIIGMSALAFAMLCIGLIDPEITRWLVIVNMVAGILFYFPAFAIFYEIEGHTGSDLLDEIKGFSRTNRYFGINLLILLISFAGIIGTSGYLSRVFYIQPYIGFFTAGPGSTGYSSMILVVISGMVAATGILFLAANVIRIIVILLKKPEKDTGIKQFPKFYYPYVLIFTILSLGIGIAGVIEYYGASPGIGILDIINIF